MSKKNKKETLILSSKGKENQNKSTVLSKNTVLVIGGGASGLMAAIMAAQNGCKVTLIEHNEKNGKKLNATGNGKCNFTNSYWDENVIRGTHPEFAKYALSAFTVEDTIAFFQSIGIYPVEKNGYFYPRSGQASSVTMLMEMKARSLGVKFKSNEHVHSIKKILGMDENGAECEFWQVLTAGWHYEARSVILSCGSCASAISGADGSGYTLAESLGHKIIKPLPALTGLRLKGNGKIFSKWSGVRTEGKITIIVNGENAAEASGELQLTEYGISGIPVFQVSRYAIRALDEGKKVSVLIDFLPYMTSTELKNEIEKRKVLCTYKNEAEQFLGWLPDKLTQAVIEYVADAEKIKHLPFEVQEGLTFANAQVASGGVSTEEIYDQTMESRIQKRIYFAGELIDIDGTCGGYNLQWAWSSGALAGRSVAGEDIK